MTFVYFQETGSLYEVLDSEPLLKVLGTGYSGFGEGKNNPAMENVQDVGPIPRGIYSISDPFDSPDHGPMVMRLVPMPQINTFGRNGFLIHGDSLEHPGQASKGCIILERSIREQVAAATDRELIVID